MLKQQQQHHQFIILQYLYNNGISKFFTWYDYKSWYPIGRPIGTTIYPGMQFTATFLKRYIFKDSMTLNDVCCYIPAWFGVIASILVGLITYECTLPCNTKQSILGVLKKLMSKRTSSVSSSNKHKRKMERRISSKHHHHQQQHNNRYMRSGSDSSLIDDDDLEDDTFLSLSSPATECAIIAMGIMGMVPAHLTRSVGGGFDNECIAMSAMCLTFYFWVRSLRADDDNSHMYGIAAGVAYFYVSFFLCVADMIQFFVYILMRKVHFLAYNCLLFS